MQSIDERISFSEIAAFSDVTGTRILSWEISALALMNESLQSARDAGPDLPKLTMDVFDDLFMKED